MGIRDGVHYCLALTATKPGAEFLLAVERGGKMLSLVMRVEEAPLRAPDALDPKVLAQGLRCSVHLGQWQTLPDFDKVAPASSDVVENVGLHVTGGPMDNFGLRFSGYIKVPVSGLYHFYTMSDDGSRLWVGDRLIVDNDGVHASIEKSGYIRLGAGVHPLAVTFFEATGEEALKVCYEGPGLPKQEVPFAALFHRSQ
jgi:hypothetical protein